LKIVSSTGLLLLLTVLGCSTGANAQSLGVFVGVGTATDSSTGQTVNTLGGAIAYPTPRLGGTFGTFGVAATLTSHWGVGGDVSFRTSLGNYAGLYYRPRFYDLNAIYQPLSKPSRWVPEVQGGIGRVTVRFYYDQQFCETFFSGCKSLTGQVSTESHFELNFAGGVRYYIKSGIFVRPQVDLHWVDNFAQFGRSWVPEYTLAVGYTLGKNHGRN